MCESTPPRVHKTLFDGNLGGVLHPLLFRPDPPPIAWRISLFPHLELPYRDSPQDANSIYVDAETRIQVLDTMLLLPRADKEQCAAFIVGLVVAFHCYFPAPSPPVSSATSALSSSGQNPSTE